MRTYVRTILLHDSEWVFLDVCADAMHSLEPPSFAGACFAAAGASVSAFLPFEFVQHWTRDQRGKILWILLLHLDGCRYYFLQVFFFRVRLRAFKRARFV